MPPHDAVLTLKEMVLSASPMHTSSLMRFLSGVAFVRNSSRLSPISHLVIPDELPAALELLGKGFELTRNAWPKSELGLRHPVLYDLNEDGA